MLVMRPSGRLSSVDAWCRARGRRRGWTGSRWCLLGMGEMKLKAELILHGPRWGFVRKDEEEVMQGQVGTTRSPGAMIGSWGRRLLMVPKARSGATASGRGPMDGSSKVDTQANEARCSREWALIRCLQQAAAQGRTERVSVVVVVEEVVVVVQQGPSRRDWMG